MSEFSNSKLSSPLAALRLHKNELTRICPDDKKAAIESHEPLILVNVDDTTGKMSVLLPRIDYMLQSGIEYDKIIVLSPTNADYENCVATTHFTGNNTVEKFARHITGNYPVRHNHILILDAVDEQASDLATILQFAAENKKSLFIIGNAEKSTAMREMIDCDAFITYNLRRE